MARGCGWSEERGAAAVEFAIVLPVLMTILLGTIDWGYHFFQREIVVNAAREGARAGSVAALADDPVAVASARVTQYLALAGLDGTVCDTTIPPLGVSIRVRVDCPGGSMTGFLNGLLPPRIVAEAEMRR